MLLGESAVGYRANASACHAMQGDQHPLRPDEWQWHEKTIVNNGRRRLKTPGPHWQGLPYN